MTVAVAPSIRLSCFAIRAAREVQVTPPIANSIERRSAGVDIGTCHPDVVRRRMWMGLWMIRP
ncbi:hypothetical protein OG203_30525 [Nocardia sp. NBC_01499]|uniref:hypothetical protein n=1 Tax=Nocardia sp. NBC_01499 TaxID=2903597 RepID=UPI0038665471